MIIRIGLSVNGSYDYLYRIPITPVSANTIVNLLDKAAVYGLIVDKVSNGDMFIDFTDNFGNLCIDPTGLTPMFTRDDFNQCSKDELIDYFIGCLRQSLVQMEVL